MKKLEKRLSSADILSPAVEAEELVAHFGRMNRVDLFTGDKTLAPQAKIKITRAVRTRLEGSPLSHILKKRGFFGRDFIVNADTLIPRPETEILVERALKAIDQRADCQKKVLEVLDLGTGSGCIAVSLTMERPDCRMTALDVSEKALKVARKNISLHGLQKKIKLLQSDLFKRFKGRQKLWDVIVSNPPYIPAGEIAGLPREVRREPRIALNGGPSGTEVIVSILEEAPGFLKDGGWILIEIGAGQSKELKRLTTVNKFYKNVSFAKDHTGIDRVLVAQKN